MNLEQIRRCENEGTIFWLFHDEVDGRFDDTAQVRFAQFLVLVVEFGAFQPTLIQRFQRNHVVRHSNDVAA